MNDFYNFFQSAKLDVDMAAYLDIGTEWKHMVSAFQYVRIYYIRSGSARLTLTDGIFAIGRRIYVLYPRFFHTERHLRPSFGALFYSYHSRPRHRALFETSPLAAPDQNGQRYRGLPVLSFIENF